MKRKEKKRKVHPETKRLTLLGETEGLSLCSSCKPKNSKALFPDSTVVTEKHQNNNKRKGKMKGKTNFLNCVQEQTLVR